MNTSAKNWSRLLKGCLYTLFITTLFIYLFPIFTQSFELKITDLKFNLRSKLNYEPSMNSDIAVVEIDDNSKKESGLDLWPYSYYADVLNNIAAGNPNSIGSDILFTVSIDTLGWENVIDAMFDAGNIINPYKVRYGSIDDKKIDINNEKLLLEYLEFEELPIVNPGLAPNVSEILYTAGGTKKADFLDASAGIGIVNINPDKDGVLRKLPIISDINGHLTPHFVLRLLASHANWELKNMKLESGYKLILHDFPLNNSLQDIEIPLDGNGNMIINYISRNKIINQANAGDFSLLSAWKVKQSKIPPALDNKTIIFGDHSSDKDVSITPLDGFQYNPIIFAIAMSNILDKSFITPTSTVSEIFSILIMAVLLFTLIRYLNVLWFGIGSLGLITLYTIINFSLFIFSGIDLALLNIIVPILITAGYALISLIYKTQIDVGVLEGSLRSYLSPNLMNKIKNNPNILKLGGERKRITVLFSDIVGFTNFTDEADPAEVQSVLEEYFSEMSNIIFKNDGIVDKYMGDGILAFFENMPDAIVSPQAAIKSAIQMQEKAYKLNKKYADQNRFPFAIRVALATGYAKVGNIGPKEKIDYTIIGSVVNLCSRLEGIGEKGDIVLDNDTHTFIKDDYQTQDLGEISLKGFEKSIHAHKIKN